jgi:hypothetical protein
MNTGSRTARGSESTLTGAAPASDALDILRARCEARAYLYGVGEIPDLHDAVDALQDHAKRHGLIDRYGQDAVQRVIANAFRAVRAGDTPA